MRQRADVCALTQRTNLLEVEAGRWQEQVGVERVVADEPPDEREAVRVDARRGEPEHDVAGLDSRAVDQAVALHKADARAAKSSSSSR